MASIRYEVNDQHKVTAIHKIVVHTFFVGDTEDPTIYAGSPMYEWERSDAGKFVKDNCVGKIMWHQCHDINTMGYKFAVVAELEEKKLSEFYLRFGKL